MKKIILILLIFTVSALSFPDSRQIPFDAEGRIQIYGPELERELGLFHDTGEFISGEIFETENVYTLELRYRIGPDIIRKIKILSEYELGELRDKISVLKNIRHGDTDISSRRALIYGSSTLALAFWGWSLPVALEVDDFKLGMGIYLLTSGTGFFLPFYLSRNKDIDMADAKLFTYGGTRGIAWGWTLGSALTDAEVEESDWSELNFYMLMTSIVSAGGLYALSRSREISSGTAESMGVWGDFGLGWGILIGLSAMYELEEKDPVNDYGKTKGYLALAPIISAGNLITGYFWGRARNYETGDAYIIRTSGTLAIQLSLCLIDMFDWWEKPTECAVLSIPLTLGGLVLGDKFLRGQDHYKGNEGFLIMLAGTTGSLIGAGMTYVLGSDSTEGYIYFAASLVTGAVSTILVRNTFINHRAKDTGSIESFPALSMMPLKDGFRIAVCTAF